ncbi:MAG TPA: hypothetical protein VJ323_09475 [Bryobacteraceae bacterium]|nr:hypothetical protein [Bryobacteraceae bacterium]
MLVSFLLHLNITALNYYAYCLLCDRQQRDTDSLRVVRLGNFLQAVCFACFIIFGVWTAYTLLQMMTPSVVGV